MLWSCMSSSKSRPTSSAMDINLKAAFFLFQAKRNVESEETKVANCVYIQKTKRRVLWKPETTRRKAFHEFNFFKILMFLVSWAMFSYRVKAHSNPFCYEVT